MSARKEDKPKRHRKRKPRTEVVSDSDSDLIISDAEEQPVEKKEKLPTAQETSSEDETTSPALGQKQNGDAQVLAAFTRYYMQRATAEFAKDLNKLRESEDFKGEALPILIDALQQGTSLFSLEEQRRVVTFGLKNGQKPG